MKKMALFYIFLLIFSMIPIQNNVDADEQVWENEYGKLTVFPMEAIGLTEVTQYCNLTWYYPNNQLDVAFRFNDSLNSGKVWYWNNDQWNQISFQHDTYNGKHYYVHKNFNVVQDNTYHFKWTYNPKTTEGKWDFLAKLSSDSWLEAYNNDRYILLDPWWNTDWDRMSSFTINSDKIDNDLVNFPMLVEINSTIAGFCQDDGDDLRFVDSTNSTEFNYEIEEWNATGTSLVWVNVTQISSSSNTVVNVYFSNPTAEQGMNKTSVWDSNYVMVQHFNETSGTHEDSTSNCTHLYVQDITTQGGSTGIVNGADYYDRGRTDYLENDDIGNFNYYTCECWFKATSLNNYMNIYSNNGATTTLYADGSSWTRGDITRPVGFFDRKSWYFITETCDAVTSYLYLNGTLQDSGASDKNLEGKFRVGTDGGANYWFDGVIDEIRLSKIVRNTSYLKAVYYNIMKNDFMEWGAMDTNLVSAPTFFNATTLSNGNINLSWTLGVNATHTLIERNTLSSWEKGSGTEIYNSTGTFFVDTYSFTEGVPYYYQAWSYNSSLNDFSGYNNSWNISAPANPTFESASLWNGEDLNITWSNDTYGYNTILIRKQGSFPSSVTDGTVVYNGTLEYYNDTGVENDYYYALYSWNKSINRYSSGLQVQWGSLTINVYDEVSGNPITNWNIFISNQDGTTTYTDENVNNSLVVSTNDLPYGVNTIIIINATDYANRTFYYDIVLNQHYTLNAYLAEINNITTYQLQVVGSVSDYGYEPPIEDAHVKITRYINASVGYQTVAIGNTDANGYCYVMLHPNVNYIVNITKTGYITSVGEFVPLTDVLSYTFRLNPETIPQKEWDLFKNNISFDAVMQGDYMELGNITITYNDVNESTINCDVYIYEVFNGVSTFKGHYDTSADSWTYINGSINTTRVHYVILYFNNTADFSDISSPYEIMLSNIHTYRGTRTPINFQNRVKSLFGEVVIGDVVILYSSIIAVAIGLFFLCILSPFHAPSALVFSGVGILGTQGIFSLWFSDEFPATLVLVAVLITMMGIMLWISKGGVEAT